jgi:hypothetical protein
MTKKKKIETRQVYTDIEKIKRWLKKNGVKAYTVDEDLIVNVQDKYIAIKPISYLPINFGIVDGDMNISNGGLKSLEGSPKHVRGNFICKNNKITNLTGCPETIDGSFDISYNSLTDIENGPKQVGKGYFCNNNQLTSLLGSPKTIMGSFHCNQNLLTGLQDGPQDVKMSYFCDNNPNLSSFEGLTLTIGKSFNCENSPLTSLKNCTISFNDYFSHTDLYSKIKELEQYYNEKGTLTMSKQEFTYAMLNNIIKEKTVSSLRKKL